jgi:hypothetical protein
VPGEGSKERRRKRSAIRPPALTGTWFGRAVSGSDGASTGSERNPPLRSRVLCRQCNSRRFVQAPAGNICSSGQTRNSRCAYLVRFSPKERTSSQPSATSVGRQQEVINLIRSPHRPPQRFASREDGTLTKAGGRARMRARRSCYRRGIAIPARRCSKAVQRFPRRGSRAHRNHFCLRCISPACRLIGGVRKLLGVARSQVWSVRLCASRAPPHQPAGR